MFTFQKIEDGILNNFEVSVGVLGNQWEENLNSIERRMFFDDLDDFLVYGLFHYVNLNYLLKKHYNIPSIL